MTVRLIPLAVEQERPCGVCQDWGTVPDPATKGKTYKLCPEDCAAARRAATKGRR